MLGAVKDPEVDCDPVGLSGMSPRDDGQISVPLLNGEH